MGDLALLYGEKLSENVWKVDRKSVVIIVDEIRLNFRSKHRLILSGTPIQNNVLELWSLFDFLMPGFLGSEKAFASRFGRPILLARDPKASPRDQEQGALAMEALHRQTLPFLLRRLKEDVLHDLPPKITQDYYCELSPVQEQLYEDFARTKAHQNLRDNFGNLAVSVGGSDDTSKHAHIFQVIFGGDGGIRTCGSQGCVCCVLCRLCSTCGRCVITRSWC
jgi:SNF2 family DNA or RNA helicase